jgi:hypothetical protein
LSAFCFTVEVSSSIAEAVFSSELACSSVREDRSMLPAAISRDAVVMVWVPRRTWLTMSTRLLRICFISASRLPRSDALVSMAIDRSPFGDAAGDLRGVARLAAQLLEQAAGDHGGGGHAHADGQQASRTA